jgi:hypothetical protein
VASIDLGQPQDPGAPSPFGIEMTGRLRAAT